MTQRMTREDIDREVGSTSFGPFAKALIRFALGPNPSSEPESSGDGRDAVWEQLLESLNGLGLLNGLSTLIDLAYPEEADRERARAGVGALLQDSAEHCLLKLVVDRDSETLGNDDVLRRHVAESMCRDLWEDDGFHELLAIRALAKCAEVERDIDELENLRRKRADAEERRDVLKRRRRRSGDATLEDVRSTITSIGKRITTAPKHDSMRPAALRQLARHLLGTKRERGKGRRAALWQPVNRSHYNAMLDIGLYGLIPNETIRLLDDLSPDDRTAGHRISAERSQIVNSQVPLPRSPGPAAKRSPGQLFPLRPI